MDTRHTVLILGGRGRLGLAVARAFARAGWRVLAQVRPGRPAPATTGTTPGIEWLPLALDDTPALLDAARGAEVVVHALNPASYGDGAWARQAPAFMEQALALSAALGATLMMPGNVYHYGSTLPARLGEDTPAAPDHAKARIRAALEARMREAATGMGVRSIVVRAGDFFGAGQGNWLDLAIAKRLERGVVMLPGPRGVPHAWAYLPDLAETFVRVAAVRDRLPAFAALHFRGHTVTMDDWLAALQTGRPPLRVKAFPWPLLRLLAPFSPTLRGLCGMRYLWLRPHALDNAGLLAYIGEEPHTPFATAVQQAVRDL